jgi:hypothetical protein
MNLRSAKDLWPFLCLLGWAAATIRVKIRTKTTILHVYWKSSRTGSKKKTCRGNPDAISPDVTSMKTGPHFHRSHPSLSKSTSLLFVLFTSWLKFGSHYPYVRAVRTSNKNRDLQLAGLIRRGLNSTRCRLFGY